MLEIILRPKVCLAVLAGIVLPLVALCSSIVILTSER